MTEEITDDLRLRLVKGWGLFKENIGKFAENVEECTVELHFESSLDERTHYKFDPDEVVFISDVAITAQNQVAFGVPFADKNKWFKMSEAELINTKTEEGSVPFNQVVNRIFKESMVDVPECPSITHLERKYLLADGEMMDALNNSDEFIAKHELQQERGKLYTKLDDFGMF